MKVSDAHLVTLFQKIKQLREELRAYVVGGDDTFVSIDNLHRMVEQMYDLRVTLKEVPFTLSHVVSMVCRYRDGTAEIVLSGGLPEPERRFAVAKELLHLVLDEPEDWSTTADVTISGLIELRELEGNGGDTQIPNQVVVCERLAEMAAIEILYPYEVRQQSEQEASEVSGQNWSKIALQYRIPVRAIRLAHHLSYKIVCDKFRIF